MAETNEVQALEKVSAEVDKSQVKIILSSQCIKAQAFLYSKLRKQSERQKEICKFISSSNSKLETEIQFAEQEIKSLHLAIETIKFSNVELKKNYLLSKERKAEIFERTKVGKKKYESIWLKAKTRYESIPYVTKLIEAKNESQEIQANIDSLISDSKHLRNKIEAKKKELVDLDKERVIELANFFVNERPKLFESIRVKSDEIKDLSKEVNVILKEQKKITSNLINEQSQHHTKQIVETIKDTPLEDSWSNLNKNINKDSLMLPRLHLQNNDLDILSVKLDQIKKVDLQNTTPIKRAGSYTSFDYEKSSYKKVKAEENINRNRITSLSNVTVDTNVKNSNEKVEIKKYSEKKLIHILEDIKLDKKDAYNIIHKLEPNQFQETKYVKSTNVDPSEKIIRSPEKMTFMEIEEINLSSQNDEENVVAPPSQYVDTTQNTQEKTDASFNINTEDNLKKMSGDGLEKSEGTNIKFQSQVKILNTSTTSEECYSTIKDMILKKHNLDLSPQPVYAKNNLKQMQNKDKIVTSKFFENKDEFENNSNINFNDENIEQCEDNELDKSKDENIMTMVIREKVSSPKIPQDTAHAGEQITGLLFNHGPEGIPECLNVSISTTGFDDSEDFPQCMDSSLLLSPKADIPTVTANNENNEVSSQEVPNFLAGFRKKGLSFFGCSPVSEGKPDSSAQNQNSGFNFTFGNDEKKGRGGLFSMFR